MTFLNEQRAEINSSKTKHSLQVKWRTGQLHFKKTFLMWIFFLKSSWLMRYLKKFKNNTIHAEW